MSVTHTRKSQVLSWLQVTFPKEKNDTRLEWRRAGKTRQGTHTRTNRDLGAGSCLFTVVQRTFVSPLYNNNKERSFSSASSSSNKSEHLKKKVSSRGSFNAFANFDEATKACGRPSFVVALTLIPRDRANCSIVSISAQRTNHCRARFMNLAPAPWPGLGVFLSF